MFMKDEIKSCERILECILKYYKKVSFDNWVKATGIGMIPIMWSSVDFSRDSNDGINRVGKYGGCVGVFILVLASVFLIVSFPISLPVYAIFGRTTRNRIEPIKETLRVLKQIKEDDPLFYVNILTSYRKVQENKGISIQYQRLVEVLKFLLERSYYVGPISSALKKHGLFEDTPKEIYVEIGSFLSGELESSSDFNLDGGSVIEPLLG